MTVACFACGSDRTRVFHSVDGVPVHSCLLMESRAAARAYPRGDLRIAFCQHCGFIQNSAFDPSVHEYSQRYEETQAFSPRFMQLVAELTEHYDQRYALAGKTVLEIGCGKGEFLVALCEAAGCSGIGIDPGYRPERTTSPARDRIEFIVDFYSRDYAHLQADMVLCRHTLEHIQPTRDFVSMVRDAVGDVPATVVAFELPDMERILAEQAFWDIYYEHCSYFTLGSLARLFRRCGFEILELTKCFDDQYLLLDARPTSAATPPAHAAEEDVEHLRGLVAGFERGLAEKMAGWRAFFEGAARRGEPVVLWGSGSKAVAFLCELQLGDAIDCVTDINPHKHGKFMPGTGHEIVAPEALAGRRPAHVVAMNPIYSDEIRAELDRLGVAAELHAV